MNIEELKNKAEQAWVSCDGCTQDDKQMWINGYLAGALSNHIELPSEEEIEDYAKEFVLSHDFSALTNPNHLANRCFQHGVKWLIEKLKQQDNGQ